MALCKIGFISVAENVFGVVCKQTLRTAFRRKLLGHRRVDMVFT